MSLLVLAESVWVLKAIYGLDPEEIASAVDYFLNHKTLTLQDSDVVRAALDNFRLHRKVEFADCLMVEIARKAGHLPLGTFDRDLARLDGAEII